MFDAVQNRHTQGPGRWGRGTLVAIAIHGAAIGGVVLYSIANAGAKTNDAPEVTFFAPPPPPPPPPPAGGGSPQPKVEKPKPKVEHKAEVQIAKKNEPVPEPEKPPTPNNSPEPGGQPGGVPGGVPGGTVGGTVGGVVGGTVGGTGNTNSAIPFGEGMTRPSQMDGSEINWPSDARAAKVEGIVLLKCNVNVDGSWSECRVLKGLAMGTEAVLAAANRHRGTPVMYQGHPQAVNMTITIKIKLQ